MDHVFSNHLEHDNMMIAHVINISEQVSCDPDDHMCKILSTQAHFPPSMANCCYYSYQTVAQLSTFVDSQLMCFQTDHIWTYFSKCDNCEMFCITIIV